MRTYQLSVFGVRISFRTDADPRDMERARVFVEEHANRLQSGGGLLSKEQILALLALGVADDLLQVQQQLSAAEMRLAGLLKRIDETVESDENIPLGGA